MLEKIKSKFDGLDLNKRFILTSLVIIILGMLGISWWVNKQIASGVIHRTSATTALYVDSFIAYHLQELDNSGNLSAEHSQMLDQLLGETSLGKQIVFFKVWDTRGVVQYSTDKSTVGIKFPIEGGLAQALNGDVASKISDLQKAENVSERSLGSRLIETYIPVRHTGSDKIIAVAEFYQKYDDLENEISAAQKKSSLVVAGAMFVVFLLLSGFVNLASKTIDRQKSELNDQVRQLTALLGQNQDLHERVRRAAASVTTINERLLRRVGAELHDGPAQDLSLALLKLDAYIEPDGETSENHQDLKPGNNHLFVVQATLQNALKELRLISKGLSLPELAQLPLEETILRAVRSHERRTNTDVELTLCDLPEQASTSTKIAIYRLIQEALNNSFRHAGGVGQQVDVNYQNSRIQVVISDHGPGFNLDKIAMEENHLGIAGMRERVESLGGEFTIESNPGSGTRVMAYLNINPVEKKYE